ncbi:MAG: deoxyribose-phosphate aldolase [bacterium]
MINFQQISEFIVKQVVALQLPSFSCKAEIKPGRVEKIEKASDISGFIDHTALKPQTNRRDIVQLCRQARKNNFYSVCVSPVYIEEAKKQLDCSNSLVVSVIDFPFGMSSRKNKVNEAKEVINLGADEIDMVIALGLLKGGEYRKVFEDIRSVVEVNETVPVKVIIETCLLEEEEKIIASLLAKKAGAAFVKTSTGFSSGGAKVKDIELIRKFVGKDMGVKASGGIINYKIAAAMLEAGANRLGCSASMDIIQVDLNK